MQRDKSGGVQGEEEREEIKGTRQERKQNEVCVSLDQQKFGAQGWYQKGSKRKRPLSKKIDFQDKYEDKKQSK